MNQNPRNEGFSDSSIFWGFCWGLVVGGIVALFNAPQRGFAIRLRTNEEPSQREEQSRHDEQSRRDDLEDVTPIDPIADSIAAGKAAARRRREELGQHK